MPPATRRTPPDNPPSTVKGGHLDGHARATSVNDLLDVVSFLREAGVIGFLVLVVIGGAKRWWVHGWLYDASQEEVRYWRELALKALDLGEAAVGRHNEAAIRRRYVDDETSVQRRGGDV